jgi:hypothetical protein
MERVIELSAAPDAALAALVIGQANRDSASAVRVPM